MLWVELKVFSASTFDKQLDETKQQLAERLPQVMRVDASLGAVLLLAARASKEGGRWAKPTLLATMLATTQQGWRDLSGACRKVARGQCATQKLPLAAVFERMEWFSCEKTRPKKVGVLKHFFAALELPGASVGKRAATFNQRLKEAGHVERLFELKVQRAGKKPWVGTKDAFRAIYNFL